MKKLFHWILVCLWILFFHHSSAEPPPNWMHNLMKQNFQDNAYCKISPHSQVLLSIPHDKDFEKKYITDDEEQLRIQCEKAIKMDMFLRNEKGVFQISTYIWTTFPLCTQIIGDQSWAGHIKRGLLVSGSFIDIPIVVSKKYNTLPGTYTMEPEEEVFPPQNPISLTPVPVNPRDEDYYRKFSLPPVISVRDFPECEPNIRLKK